MASRYFVGTGNWSDINHWSDTSGGTVGQSVPGYSDDVYLDANSGVCTVDTGAERGCKNLYCTGYTSEFILNHDIKVGASTGSGTFTFVTGMTFTPNTYKFIQESNGATTITTANKIFHDFEFRTSLAYNRTVTITGTLDIDGDFIVNQFGSSSKIYTLTLNTGAIQVAGNVSLSTSSNSYSQVKGSSTLTLNGTGTWSDDTPDNGFMICGLNVTINTSGTITFAADDIGFGNSTANTLTYTAGTVITTGSNIGAVYSSSPAAVGGPFKMNTAGIAWAEITVLNTTLTLMSNLDVSYININRTAANTKLDCSTYQVNISGNFTSNESTSGQGLVATNSTWIFDGNTYFNAPVAVTIKNVTINSGSTLSINPTADFIITGTFNATGSSGSHVTLNSHTPSTVVDFDVTTVGTITYVDATDIDSAGGSQITTIGGSITRTVNWVLENVIYKKSHGYFF